MKNNSITNLTVGHINCQSLDAHLSDVLSAIHNHKIHALALSEFWLTPAMDSRRFYKPDYELLFVDRIGKGGGEVALSVHKSLRARIIFKSPQPLIYVKRF